MSDTGDTMATDLEPLMLDLGKAVYICQAFESSLCLLHAMMTHEEAGRRVPSPHRGTFIPQRRLARQSMRFASESTYRLTSTIILKRVSSAAIRLSMVL